MKYFGTDGFRGKANENLCVEHALRIGQFIGWYFGKNKGKKASGILYSSITGRGESGSARNYAIVFLAICAVIAVISLKSGKIQRALL